MTGWNRPFEDPVVLPNGKPLTTLKDAARYIQKLPKAEHDKLHWQTAIECLIMAAENRGPLLHARIGMLKALGRGKAATGYTSERPSTPAKKWSRRR
jgi:hypothetical protein